MRFFELSLSGLIIRFYVMMAVVILAGFTGAWALALLALPIFLSGMLGMVLNRNKAPQSVAVLAPNMATAIDLPATPQSDASIPALVA